MRRGGVREEVREEDGLGGRPGIGEEMEEGGVEVVVG